MAIIYYNLEILFLKYMVDDDDLYLRENIPEDEPKNAHSHLRALLLGNHVKCSF